MGFGRYTLVTGASSGIGEAVAIRLSGDRGVIVHGRSEARIQATLAKCSNPEAHRGWACDLSDPESAGESLGAVLNTLHEQGGAVESLVHCAGVTHVAPIRQTTLDETRAVFGVNFFAAVNLVRVLVANDPEFKSLRSIVFISSAASLLGENGAAIYCASKGAINSFVRSLAAELAPAVRVNAILPGLVRTPMAQSTLDDPGMKDVLASKYPLGVGETGDIAEAAAFLTSDRARWVTGALWQVDGGRTVV